MSRTLNLADDLKLPLDSVLLKQAILAMSGAGKSNTATDLVEETLDSNVQVIILDPKGDWWGLKSSSGTFRNYMSLMRTGGYIEESGETLWASQLTLATWRLGHQRVPRNPADVQAMWRSKLTGGCRTMFDHLLEVHPGTVTMESLAQHAGISHDSGTFRNYVSILRTNGLIVEDGKGAERRVRAADILFEVV